MNWRVYIIKSEKDEWYYVESTNRLERRLLEHNRGQVRSTKAFRPYTLVFSRQFNSESEAREYESKIKDKRTEKEAIIKSIRKN